MRAAHNRQRLIAAAVHHFKEHGVTRSGRFLRPEEQHVGRKLDLSFAVPRSKVEVCDAPVSWEIRIDGKVNTADHPFVRPGVVSALDLDLDNFRRCNATEQ